MRNHLCIKPFIALFFIFMASDQAWSKENLDFLLKTDKTRYERIQVEQVISADTFILANGERVKLIGIKAPRPPKPKEYIYKDVNGIKVPVEPEISFLNSIEDDSFNFVKDLLEGQFVKLEFDEQKKDDNLQTLAYVFLEDGTFVNTEILKNGFADLSLQPINSKYSQQLRAAYLEAKKEKRGLQGD